MADSYLLREAARNGDLNRVRQMLQRGADLHAADDYGWNALHYAAREGHTDVVSELLQRGANVHSAEKQGQNPLHKAALNGQMGVVKELLQHGADAHRVDNYSQNALHIAALSGHIDVVRELLRGDDIVGDSTKESGSFLYEATQCGDIHTVRELLQSGADVHCENKDGWNALHIAAINGHMDMMKELLQGGADMKRATKVGGYPLHFAASNGNLNMVRELLQLGAEVHSVDNYGRNAFHIAALNGHMGVVKALLQHGADIHSADKDGQNALQRAARRGHMDVIEKLAQLGADLHNADNNGYNALHRAARNGHMEVVEKLVQLGADVHDTDNEGWNALHRAGRDGHMNVVKGLLRLGAEVHSVDNYGWNALHHAAHDGHLDVVKELLHVGADVHSVNNYGWNALHHAAWNGHTDVVKELLQLGADVHSATDKGRNALHHAARNGHMDVAVALLHCRADLLRQDTLGDTALHLAAFRGHTQLAAMLWRAGADPFKRNSILRSARASLKTKDRELYKLMGVGRVRKPTLPPLPPLPPAAIVAPTLLTPLQDALQSVLLTSTGASEYCTTLITKQNCSRSLPEWKAAHDLLVLAVTDDHNIIHPEHPDDKLYFWKDQLYCTVSDLPITNDQDKLVVFDCLHQAQKLNLIDSADAYIQGIHLSQTVNSELFVLKKACITLFERLVSLETTLDDLRASFDAYRQQQLYCNVIAIALKLIPIAGGAVSNALEVAAELCGELSGADVIEYSLSTACAILEEHNFCKLPPSKQTQLVNVFEEYGFTTEQVRCLFYSRGIVVGESIKDAPPPLEASSSSDHCGRSRSALNGPPTFTEDSTANCCHRNTSDENGSCEGDPNESETDSCEDDSGEDNSNGTDSVPSDNHDIHEEKQTEGNLNRNDSTLATNEFAKNWTHFILNATHDDEQLFGPWNQCLKRFLHGENVSPRILRSGTRSNISRFTNGANQFVQHEMHQNEMKIGYRLRMVQFVHQYLQQNNDQRSLTPGNSQTAIIDMAREWTQFTFASSDEEIQLQSRLNECLVRLLEGHSVSPPSLKFGLPSDIRELQNAVEQFVEDELGEEMKLGYYFKLTQFLNQFSQDC